MYFNIETKKHKISSDGSYYSAKIKGSSYHIEDEGIRGLALKIEETFSERFNDPDDIHHDEHIIITDKATFILECIEKQMLSMQPHGTYKVYSISWDDLNTWFERNNFNFMKFIMQYNSSMHNKKMTAESAKSEADQIFYNILDKLTDPKLNPFDSFSRMFTIEGKKHLILIDLDNQLIRLKNRFNNLYAEIDINDLDPILDQPYYNE